MCSWTLASQKIKESSMHFKATRQKNTQICSLFPYTEHRDQEMCWNGVFSIMHTSNVLVRTDSK